MRDEREGVTRLEKTHDLRVFGQPLERAVLAEGFDPWPGSDERLPDGSAKCSGVGGLFRRDDGQVGELLAQIVVLRESIETGLVERVVDRAVLDVAPEERVGVQLLEAAVADQLLRTGMVGSARMSEIIERAKSINPA